MTSPGLSWPPTSQIGPAPGDTGAAQDDAARRKRLFEIVTFAVSVMLFLVFSQAWVMPVLGDRTDEAASSLVRNLFFPAYAGALFLAALRPMDVLRVLIREPFLILLMMIVAASITWSVAPDQTQRRIVALAFTTLSGIVIGARWRWARLAEVFATAFAILAVASLITGLFIPSIGRMTTLFPGAWRGLWLEKNAFGGLMTFAVLFFCSAALFAPRRWMLWSGMAVLGFGLLLMSTSKTSLVALLLGLACLGFVVLVRRGGAVTVVAVYGAVVGLAGLGAALWLAPDVFLGLLGKDATLTGRTKIWSAVIRQIHERPLLGYGYGAVWSETSNWGPLAWITRDAGFKAEHAHNSWLEQWLGIGLVGLCAWAAYYLSTLARAVWAVFTGRGALLVFPFLMVFTLISLTESVALVYNDLRWVMFVALASRLALPEPAPDVD